MDNIVHLSKEQIKAYVEDTLKTSESHKIGRHLIKCEVCRKRLPIPTVEQFLKAIFGKSKMGDSLPPNK